MERASGFPRLPSRSLWFLDLFYRYQKVDGDNAIEAGTALRPPTNPAQSIAECDDTKINFVSGQVRYKLAQDWTFGLGAFWEDYEIRDTQTDEVLFYMPGSFFINANNTDYQSWVGSLNLSYSF